MLVQDCISVTVANFCRAEVFVSKVWEFPPHIDIHVYKDEHHDYVFIPIFFIFAGILMLDMISALQCSIDIIPQVDNRTSDTVVKLETNRYNPYLRKKLLQNNTHADNQGDVFRVIFLPPQNAYDWEITSSDVHVICEGTFRFSFRKKTLYIKLFTTVYFI